MWAGGPDTALKSWASPGAGQGLPSQGCSRSASQRCGGGPQAQAPTQPCSEGLCTQPCPLLAAWLVHPGTGLALPWPCFLSLLPADPDLLSPSDPLGAESEAANPARPALTALCGHTGLIPEGQLALRGQNLRKGRALHALIRRSASASVSGKPFRLWLRVQGRLLWGPS